MKSSLLLGLAIAFTSAKALASPITGEADNYPVNFARCNYIVNAPENSKYIFSRDCKTVYILPPSIGAFRAAVGLDDAVLKHMCPLFEMAGEQVLEKARLQNTARRRITVLESLANPTQKELAELDRLTKLTERLQQEIYQMGDPFREVEGGKASFALQADVPQSLIKEFYSENQNLVYDKRIKFEPLPVSLGYLSITNYQASPSIKVPSALAIFANGIPLDPTGKSGNTYKIKSSMAGQIVMGLGKACTLYDRRNSARAKGRELSAGELGQEFITEIAPTFSYAYPVMSTVSYKARIDTIRATELFFRMDKTKTQFHVSEFASLLGQGTASDAFQMEIDLGDLGDRYTSQEDRQKFLAALTMDVRNRLTEKFVRELASVDLVKYEAEPPAKVPEPGYKQEPVGTVRRCSSDSFLGITYATSCRDEVVTRTVPVAGTLEDVTKKVQDFKISVSEEVKIRELVLHSDNVIFQ